MGKFTRQVIPVIVLTTFIVSCTPSVQEPPPTQEPPEVIQAREALNHQIQYWTRTMGGDLPLSSTHATFMLTYLSPQLIEAGILYKGVMEGLSETEINDLRQEVLDRLMTENRIAFILTIEADFRGEDFGIPSQQDAYVLALNLSQSMSAISIRGESVRPTEYDRIFDIEIGNGIRRGFVFFPTHNNDKQIIDIAHDASITVKLENISFSPTESASSVALTGASGQLFTQVAWNYNLVPVEFPVEKLAQREMPPEFRLSADDLISLIDIALTFIELVSLAI